MYHIRCCFDVSRFPLSSGEQLNSVMQAHARFVHGSTVLILLLSDEIAVIFVRITAKFSAFGVKLAVILDLASQMHCKHVH